MEDILASIRRILNEGDGEPAAEAVEQPAHAAVPPPANPEIPAAVTPSAEDVYVLTPQQETQSASLPVNEPVVGEDVFVLDTAMMVADTAAAQPAADEPPLASNETMAAAGQSVGALKKALTERHAQVYRAQATSLEEIVREEVRPMLKSWLDAHLPSIVERLVRTEIERVVSREML